MTPTPEDLIPHRSPMLFLTGVKHWDRHHAVCQAQIGKDSAFARGESIPGFAFIEAAAQAAAVHEAINRSESDGKPVMGYLVGMEDIEIKKNEVQAAKQVTVSATLETLLPPLSVYRFSVSEDDQVIISGLLKTYASGHNVRKQKN